MSQICAHVDVEHDSRSAMTYCKQCGAVLSSTLLVQSIDSNDPQKTTGDDFQFIDNPRPGRYRDRYFEEYKLAETLLKNLGIGVAGWLDRTIGIIDKLHDAKLMKRGRSGCVFVAATVYFIGRISKSSIKMADVARCIGEHVKMIGKSYRLIVNIQKEDSVYVSVPINPEIYLERHLQVFLQALEECRVYCRQKEQVFVDLCKKLIKLSEANWITSGRKPDVIAVSVIVFVLEASLFESGLCDQVIVKKVFRTAINKCQISSRTLNERIKELKELIMERASQLPWISNVKFEFAHTYLFDVFDYASNQKKEPSRPPVLIQGDLNAENRSEQISKAKLRILRLIESYNTISLEESQITEVDVLIERLLLANVSEELIKGCKTTAKLKQLAAEYTLL